MNYGFIDAVLKRAKIAGTRVLWGWGNGFAFRNYRVCFFVAKVQPIQVEYLKEVPLDQVRD